MGNRHSLFIDLNKDSRVNYRLSGKNLGHERARNLSVHDTETQGCNFHLVLNPDINFEARTSNPSRSTCKTTLKGVS